MKNLQKSAAIAGMVIALIVGFTLGYNTNNPRFDLPEEITEAVPGDRLEILGKSGRRLELGFNHDITATIEDDNYLALWKNGEIIYQDLTGYFNAEEAAEAIKATK